MKSVKKTTVKKLMSNRLTQRNQSFANAPAMNYSGMEKYVPFATEPDDYFENY